MIKSELKINIERHYRDNSKLRIVKLLNDTMKLGLMKAKTLADNLSFNDNTKIFNQEFDNLWNSLSKYDKQLLRLYKHDNSN